MKLVNFNVKPIAIAVSQNVKLNKHLFANLFQKAMVQFAIQLVADGVHLESFNHMKVDKQNVCHAQRVIHLF
jgi:hypothetical protein